MRDVLLILSGYLLGSTPWGYWLPRILTGVNIRKIGSGNTGAATAHVTATGSATTGAGGASGDSGPALATATGTPRESTEGAGTTMRLRLPLTVARASWAR